MKNRMLYDKPAPCWEEGLPIGNGRLGAMILGNCQREVISLNEDTLWSGFPRDYTDAQAFPYLEKVRKAVFEKRYAEAEELLNRHMTGVWNESYLPMADLKIEWEEADTAVQDYQRILDLSEGVCKVSFEMGQNRHQRTAFASFPDQVIVLKFETEKPVTMHLSLSSKLRGWNETDDDTLCYHGWCPEEVEPSYYECEEPVRYRSFEESRSIHFETAVKVLVPQGTLETGEGEFCIRDCRDCILLVSSANSFLGWDRQPRGTYRERLKEILGAAAEKSYETLLKRHQEDYKALFGRVELDLGHTEQEELPMDERLRAFHKAEDDPELIATAFQFGRYLTIASSREGSQPANLQGIWNQALRAPWSSNYTININTEMNYWAVESGNLSDCAHPLLKFVEECAASGAKTARINYHCDGWCVHHNVDLWRKTTAVGPRKRELNVQPWSFWLAGGGWLCRHLYEHYRYTCDQDFLETKAFPISLDCAAFYLDFLVEKDGELVTCPSTSPENKFLDHGMTTGVSFAASMDMEVIEELFRHCLWMAERLKTVGQKQRVLLEKIEKALQRLPQRKIGKYGQLQEWAEDYEESEVTHRHLSHLYGLYPSELFLERYGGDETWKDAFRTVLKRRGNEGVPWSRAWKIALRARLGDGKEAGEEVLRYLKLADSPDAKEISYTEGGIYPNLFAARPLQIDGCLGFTAGVIEMLLQDADGKVRLLPAIPADWKKGYVRGLKLRGGECIEIRWDEQGCESRLYRG